jgi:3-deoxy-D-manno-octulosonate 8-phosphate phosphatase (KDO 8-P phosphatase)
VPASSERAFPAPLAQLARAVRLLVLDVDGVLTDGTLYFSDGGEQLKAFHIHDGLGVKLLRASGVQVAIVTGRRSRALEQRARELGVERLFQGAEDKLAAFSSLLAAQGLEPAQAACMGDDLPDLPLLTRCGLAMTVPEAPEAIRSRVHYITRRGGGRGAVREVCELLMQAQGTLAGAIEDYLK